MNAHEVPFSYLIQSLVPGVQGDNGCWCDEDIIEASSPTEALAKWGDYRLHDPEGKRFGLPRSRVRVCQVPEWAFFDVGAAKSYTETFTFEATDDPRGWIKRLVGRE